MTITSPHPGLGMGTATLGNLYRVMEDAQAHATVEAALAGGITLFDTAPHYGFGLAERRLGAVLAGRGDVAISTKVGRVLVPTTATGLRHGFLDADPFEPVFDYSADGIRRSFDGSLARLGVTRVDTLLAHDLGAMTHGADHAAHLRAFLDGGYRAMADLKASGATRAIGIGVNEVAVCLELLAHVDLDVILLAGRYTLLEQGALDELLPLCVARGVRVMVGGPFNSGILAGEAGGHYNYAPAPDDVRARAAALRAACVDHGADLAAAALAFPAAHPAVGAVVAGMASVVEVDAALHNWRNPPPPSLWPALRDAGLIALTAPLPATKAASHA